MHHPPEVLLDGPRGPATDDANAGAFSRAITQHAHAIRRVLEAAMRSAPSWRERDLVQTLGLDRSLVGRLVRAGRTTGQRELIQELPSAEGMAAILDALRASGLIDDDLLSAGKASLQRFDAFVDAYPGKRRAVMVRLASELPSERETIDRRARRAMFQAASDLLGYRVRHAVVTLLIVDGPDPERFDTLYLYSKFGLERTRADGPPIIVSSLRAGKSSTGPGFLPADPGADRNDATAALLQEFCTGPARVQFVDVTPERTELHISSDTPPLHHPIDVLCAQRADGVLLRRRREGFAHEWRRTVSRIPAERVSIDFVFGPGVYEGVEIAVSEHLFRSELPLHPSATGSRADQLRSSAQIGRVTAGIDALTLDDEPGYGQALRTMLGYAGLDARACRSARVSKQYPELNSELICWFPLPDR